MTRPSQRTSGRRKKVLTLPSGVRAIHFEAKAHRTPQCSRCGAELHGVVTGRPVGVAKSSRVPSRLFAGVLCGNCLASEIRRVARASGSMD
ncbi:50S ribosomal protein L34e [Candidatus Bathyarchaeota archaeon]|nr:MAG: 50S ribosomal protein L34e [Candidatus Bathyarchaeota archaeon]TMI53519.1 MAG: 50S ribosomal protein L34e [Candidatus Bathyarchaeota archaeon]